MLIHIGYHKTGTTWLQNVLFRFHPQLEMACSHQEIYTQLIRPNSLDFSIKKTSCFFKEAIERIINSGKTPLISSEILCGSPFNGGRESKMIADRLVKVFPKAKILIVIRKQENAITSTYKQYIQGGGTGSLNQFITPPKFSFSYNWFSPEHFFYHRLVKYYLSIFGKSNVKVMFYEDFTKDPLNFCNDILSFIGLPSINKEIFPKKEFQKRYLQSLSDLSVFIKRYINRFVRTPTNPYPLLNLPFLQHCSLALLNLLDRLILNKLKIEFIHKKVIRKYNKFFSESNRQLGIMLKKDLSLLGYQ